MLVVALVASAALAQFGRRRGYGINPVTRDSFDGAFNFCRIQFAQAANGDGGDWSVDHSAAERTIGWRPEVDMREGIRRLIAWREASAR